MVALTSVSFVVLFACSWIFVLCQETQEVTVKPGENVTLQCQSHRDADIEVIKWIRTDLKSDDDFVFYFTPNQTNGEHQNSLFQGRVELQHPEKKDGDASVILENVTIKDTGTYECWIAVKNNTKRRKRDAPEPISTIELTVIETQELKVKPGEDAILQCRGHRGATIDLIKWIRPDMKSDDYVFFRDGSSNENNQHESYRGRVELRDPEMKDGDASVILKNVNINDAGTYECQIREKNEKGKAELVTIVNMRVSGHTAGHKEGGDKEGGGKERNVGLRVGLPVCVILLLLGVGGFVILYNRPKGNQQPAINRHELQNLQRD